MNDTFVVIVSQYGAELGTADKEGLSALDLVLLDSPRTKLRKSKSCHCCNVYLTK